MIVFAVAGAALRTWGAAYLGATTVQRGGMVGDRIIADGPYRFVRNPLYLGTVLHTIAVSLLMRPEAGVLCLALITFLQFRLIFREEPIPARSLGRTVRGIPGEGAAVHPVDSAPNRTRQQPSVVDTGRAQRSVCDRHGADVRCSGLVARLRMGELRAAGDAGNRDLAWDFGGGAGVYSEGWILAACVVEGVTLCEALSKLPVATSLSICTCVPFAITPPRT